MPDHQVVVVGAGPAGLTAAIALARASIDVLVVERRLTGSEQPRATVLSLRTMELLRSWGLEAKIWALADDVEMTMLEIPTAARADEGATYDVGIPTAAQSAVVSPTAAACVAQDHLEAVLLDHLASLPAATVHRGDEVVDVTSGDGYATVTLRDSGDVLRAVTAAYVIAADGVRSAVRDALGLELIGRDDLMEGVSVEFRAPLWEILGEHRHLLYSITDPDAAGVLLPAGVGDRWVFGIQVGYGPPVSDNPTREELRERIARAVGVPEVDIRIDRYRHYTAGAQLAERFSQGSVFLIGDAAHRVTPRGGTGLNIAIADGFDLGWKLSWVLREWASPSLLNTYESERRPTVAHNVERSADPVGSRRPASTELSVDLRGRVGHAWDDTDLSTLDLIGDGLTLFVGEGRNAWASASAAMSSRVPIAVVELGALSTRALGINAAGALLVRPDAKPVASWWSADGATEQLRRAITAVTNAGRPDATHHESAA